MNPNDSGSFRVTLAPAQEYRNAATRDCPLG